MQATPDDPQDTREELRSRRISTEDMVRFLLADINRLRSDVLNPNRVLAWSESLEALADLLQPWAANDAQDRFNKEWEQRPCRVVRVPHPDGDPRKDRLVPFPTAQDCRAAQTVIMGLLDRAGLLVKRRTISGPAGRKAAAGGPTDAQDGDGGLETTDDALGPGERAL